MSDWYNTDTGETVYRSRDSVQNLRVRVHLERLTSTAVLSQHLQQQVLSQQKVLSQQDRGPIELETLTPQGHAGDTEEELVVGWQEKFFSQYELELFQNEAACQTPLDRQYHTEVIALIKNKGQRNHRIFTYTDHDRYTTCPPTIPTQNSDFLKMSTSGPTLLAERMSSLRHRRPERRTIDRSLPRSKVITWEPSKEFVRSSRVVNNAMQTMHIMGDLGPPGRLGQKENECLLFTIKTDGSGTVIVKPDFNKDKEPYRIITAGEKREVWCLILENVSPAMKPEEEEREQDMYRDLCVRHKEYLRGVVGPDFEMPPAGFLRYLLNGQIVSAKGFDYDNLYIHFFMELPSNWSGSTSSHSGVTQTCRTKAVGKENVAFFSFPFSFEAFYLSDRERDESVSQWPVLYFQVVSLDSWQCYRTEGYGFLLVPALPGEHTVTCHTWRPLRPGTTSALRRFFIGGSPELEEPSYVRIPGTFKGERLSRFGFVTETTGSVTFDLHCIQQARAFVDASVLKRRRQKVLEQLGGFSQQGAICNVLEAFQRARRKMQEARESLPQDLLSESSALV